MKYVIKATEQSYGGLHGIEEWRVVEAATLALVEEEAAEMSCYLMGSYSFIEEDIRTKAALYCDPDTDEDSEEFEKAYTEAVEENIAYSIWQIEGEYAEAPIEVIEQVVDQDPESFVSDCCTLVVIC